MKQKDHKSLAYYLIDSVGDCRVWQGRWHRRFFLWGCIFPDFIPFTYLRGFRQSRAMLGHNARYSFSHIQRSIQKLEARTKLRIRDFYRLGTLMHYLADSFTYPHTDAFCGDLQAHRAYERDLHGQFPIYLRQDRKITRGTLSEKSLSEHLLDTRNVYENTTASCEDDCRQIVHTCTEVFWALCGAQK